MSKFQNLCILLLLATEPFLISTALSQEVPRTMTKISTRVVEPKPKPGSFSAQPTTYWRAGTKYARVAEAPDSQNHIHGLIIINEPDLWEINLFDKSGKHVVDPGPSFNVQLPIFEAPSGVKTKLDELEFGRELEFFSRNNARRSTGDVISGRTSDRHEVTIGGSRLVLWTDIKSKKPVRVSLIQGMQTQTIEYLAYDDNLIFSLSLFQPPAGIAMKDSK